ncbi:hypothetical protein COX11_00165 [Candidatus Berkelbacteria bacterium CG23_combo_of_CG06-09_8_20_14_all_41_73]|uniref:Uncharacterized protein n=2 Tax=Candidatus Berkelbacteria TaxID=1618330 RepID=A0A2H0B0E8_9BACT|nr:MAG: hypothetical protein COX11_00165 [Candidatus Berkelbacteria bacterium CG23_combo_of_CG06-09_8_20_14_all_41_73]PIR27427.1 MAG: hypothetical protein COV40_00885 [Candidatus Berkelbacteria bacterium CG11_big_fil_rev_8_21_14_0_20_42_15]
MKTFIIVLITILITGGVVGGGGYYYMKNKSDKDKKALQTEIKELQQQALELKIAKSGDTTNWKSYSSKELGLSFKYPEVWGEPYTHLEDYSDQKQLNNPYFAGRFYSVCFSEGRYCVVGYSADYKTYESAVDNYYIGDEKSLDTAETDVARDSKKSTISFIQKAAVAAVMTRTKTLFYYLSEASGVGARSQTYLNGKSDYPGLLISTYYKNLSDSLNILYDKTGGKNEALEKKAEEELKTLEGGTSNSQSQFNLYKTWLTTFSYNK